MCDQTLSVNKRSLKLFAGAMTRRPFYLQPASVEPPKECFDLIVPRRKDAFIRQELDGTILNHREDLDSLAFKPFEDLPNISDIERFDELGIESANLQALSENAVVIVADFEPDADGKVQIIPGSGILMSDDVIFTCKHIFAKINGCKVAKITVSRHPIDDAGEFTGPFYEAILIPMEEYFLGDRNIMNQVFPLVRWPFGVDFAVLKLLKPVISFNYPVLSAFEAPPSSALATVGFPGEMEDSRKVTSMFPIYYVDYLSDIHEKKELNDILVTFFRASFFNFNSFVTCFGQKHSDKKKNQMNFAYRQADFSLSNGMSGAGVVSLDAPNVLEGITVGGAEGMGINFYLSAQHPAVKAAFKKYVLKI